MKQVFFEYSNAGCGAFMGGIYGNLPALEACLADARAAGAEVNVFLGDITGCCGHSAEVVDLVRKRFAVVIAGNHEQEAAAGSDVCGCGYESPEDEKYSCLAHQYAMQSLDVDSRRWMGALPDMGRLRLGGATLLLCHGSPERTNEFLYESEVDPARLQSWLEHFRVRGLICTHTGLPWLREFAGRRFAINCGVVGKPDHDGDPAVHYALVRWDGEGYFVELRRVTYDHLAWVAQLEAEGVDPIFTMPLRTGIWTTGVNSLPALERSRTARLDL